MTTLQAQARALGDPTRHAIFRYLASSDRAVSVAELTEHLGLNHNAIRQHLAKLVDAELVDEATAPPKGPGRPHLVYAIDPRAESRWGVAGPYERLSLLLSEVISSGDTPVEVGRRAGRAGHRSTGSRATGGPEAAIAEVTAAMAREGFDPEVHRSDGGTDIVLRNCPFQSAAAADPDTVCQLHRGLAEGVAEGIDTIEVDELIAKDPSRAGCRLGLRIEGLEELEGNS